MQSVRRKEKESDFSEDTLLSLLGLLKPLEFFVSVDHSAVWKRHLAWSKSKGSDLRIQITQRFSSNLVFLSLMLASELQVLFNSSSITTDMRKSLEESNIADLKWWIGLLIILSVCVTITALVATFTAWGMINAVSDVNVHCVIRSSIGQYVTHLPSRLVVSALYLFLFWVILFFVEMLNGWLGFVLVVVILVLFFQVVVALSCFGRLIIHCGAMGEKRILDEELESCLLPSGLHASLLIKATERLNRRTSVVTQYKSSGGSARSGRRDESSNASDTNSAKRHNSGGGNSQKSSGKSKRNKPSSQDSSRRDSFLLREDEELRIVTSARAFSGHGSELEQVPSSESIETTPLAMSREASDSSFELDGGTPPSSGRPPRPPLTEDTFSPSNSEITDSIKSKMRKQLAARRESSAIMKHLVEHHHRDLHSEWDDEKEARALYGAPPPPDLPSDDDEDMSDEEVAMPRASVLNRSLNWMSLRRLVKDVESDLEASNSSRLNATEPPSPQGGMFQPMYTMARTLSGAVEEEGDSEGSADDSSDPEKAGEESRRLMPDSDMQYSSIESSRRHG